MRLSAFVAGACALAGLQGVHGASHLETVDNCKCMPTKVFNQDASAAVICGASACAGGLKPAAKPAGVTDDLGYATAVMTKGLGCPATPSDPKLQSKLPIVADGKCQKLKGTILNLPFTLYATAKCEKGSDGKITATYSVYNQDDPTCSKPPSRLLPPPPAAAPSPVAKKDDASGASSPRAGTWQYMLQAVVLSGLAVAALA